VPRLPSGPRSRDRAPEDPSTAGGHGRSEAWTAEGADGRTGRIVVRELDRREVQRRFALLPMADRRAVLRAVSRGREAPSRELALVTIGVARRQQRFWRLAWLMGPVLGLVQLAYLPVEQALVSVAIGTAVLGAMSLWWLRRARRSEERTRVMGGATSSPDGRRAALPRRLGTSPRPPRPRGRKRG
jgi:hypothetical protein